MSRDLSKHTENTYKRVPEDYFMTANDIQAIHLISSEFDKIVEAWKLGFEQAYQAAKAGRLDFQK